MTTDNTEIQQAERAGVDLYEGWTTAYNAVDGDGHQSLLGLPHASFGGGRPTRDVLAVAVRRDQYQGVKERVTHRDKGWGHSAHDNIRHVQMTPDKSHLVADIVRYEEDGTPYGVGWSRLQVAYRDENGWRIRILSSCGLRNPDVPEVSDDAQIVAGAEQLIRDVVESINRNDAESLRSLINFPFVRLPGARFDVVDDAASLQLSEASDGWTRSEITKVSAFPPQSGDKVAVEVEVKRWNAQGEELPPEGAMCLVTKQDGQWGLQMCSTRAGLAGLP